MNRRRGLHTSPFNSPIAALLDDEPEAATASPVLVQDEALPESTPVLVDRAAEPLATRRVKLRVPVNRTGTRAAPYERKDGIATVKIAFSASADFEAKLRMFVAGLPPTVTRNQWLEQALTRAMAREKQR